MFKYLLSTIFLINITLSLFSQNWQQIGPYGGYFKEFTFHPNNSSIIYAGSDDGGGIWKSSDMGNTWILLTTNYPNMTGWKITIDENSPNTIYACDVYSRYGILKSTDGGSTWSNPINGLNSERDKMVSGLSILSTDTLIISTGESATTTPPRPGNGVFKSFDGGNTWNPAGLQNMTTPCIGNNVFGTIFVGTEDHGLFYSNDYGTTWTIHPDVSSTAICHEIDVKDSIILIGTNFGVYLSSNYGINFTNIGLSGEFNFDVTIHQIQPNIEVYSSTINGLKYYSSATGSWTVENDPEFAGQLVIGIQSDGTNIYTSTFSNYLIIKSSDSGNTWFTTPDSPICTELNAIFVDPTNNNRILTGMMGSYNVGASFNKSALRETNNGGNTWLSKGPNAHALALTSNPQNSNSMFLGTFSSGLFKTNNSFNTYSNLITGNKLVGDIAISNADTNIILISEVDLDLFTGSIKRSNDGGNTFTTSSNNFAHRITFNSNSYDTAYAATDNGIFISIDNGISWNPWVLSGETILSLLHTNGVLYAGNNLGTLYRIENSMATDISGSWQTPLELKSIYSINDQLFIGLSGAEKDTTYNLFGSIWQRSINGTTWTNITDQMTSTNVYGNNVIESDGNELYVGTYGGGVFKSNGLSLNVQNNKESEEFNIFPNPSSNYIKITSDIHAINDIKIFNILGQDVSYLVNISSDKKNCVSLDLFKLKTGIYVLQINETNANKVYKQ